MGPGTGGRRVGSCGGPERGWGGTGLESRVGIGLGSHWADGKGVEGVGEGWGWWVVDGEGVGGAVAGGAGRSRGFTGGVFGG